MSEWIGDKDHGTGSREFETVAAELWLSHKNGASRKFQTQQRRKNNEKRDSMVRLAPLAEGSPKRLKEKSSWLGMSRSGYATTASAAGQWVKVKCSLVEDSEGDNVMLNILGEKGTLQHSLHVNRLRMTDIRVADRSLFFRDDCLGIHCRINAFAAHSPSHQTLLSSSTPDHGDQRQTHRRNQSGPPVFEPIYLSFESKDAVNCWSALLRSYAQPEIYGSNVNPGGLFRMWRQVEITILSGRGLNVSGKRTTGGTAPSGSSFDADHADGCTVDGNHDLEVFCELFLDGLVSGRTTSQKGQVVPGTEVPIWTWHEAFMLSDLPPFGNLCIRVWREKKSSKPVLSGLVEIALANFRRGNFVEGWSPVIFSGPSRNDVQVGDLRLKIKVDEEIILPLESYAGLSALLDERNGLELLCDLEQKIQLGEISTHILSLAVGRGTFMKDIMALAEREVAVAPNANTLFRGNSVFTKTVEQAMLFFGKQFLDASVGPSIQELCMGRVEIEIDPSRRPNRPKDIESGIKLLPLWCAKFWDQIYKVRGQCPSELRRLFQCIRECVENRFGAQAAELRWQSVSAFCFLRLIVPAIIHPHLFGLHPGLPAPAQQRSLTLIAKSIQSLANLSRDQKEMWMSTNGSFVSENIPAMVDYIIQVSSFPSTDRGGHVDTSDRYDRLRIMQSLRDRARGPHPLTNEAIPTLPHLLDIPKCYAMVSSAVIRHSRNKYNSFPAKPASLVDEMLVGDLTMRCIEIEDKAVELVNCLTSLSTLIDHDSRTSRTVSGRTASDRPRRKHSVENAQFSHSASDSLEQQTIPNPQPMSSRPSTAPAAASSSGSSALNSPVSSPSVSSPITFAPQRDFPNDSGRTSPIGSSSIRRRSSINSGDNLSSTDAMSIPSSRPLYRVHSHHLPVSLAFDEEAAAKRRGFLRGFLARSTK